MSGMSLIHTIKQWHWHLENIYGDLRASMSRLSHALSPPRKFQANISFPALLPLPLYSMLWSKKNKNTGSYILVEGVSYSRNPSPHKFFSLCWYTVLLYRPGWSWTLHPPPLSASQVIRTSSSSPYHAHWDSRFSRNPDSNPSIFYPHNHY